MYELNFPYDRRRYVCGICGFVSADRKKVEACEALGRPEETDLKIGDKIPLVTTRERGDGSLCYEDWYIRDIYYQPSKSGLNASSYAFHLEHPAHSLMIDVIGRDRENPNSTAHPMNEVDIYDYRV